MFDPIDITLVDPRTFDGNPYEIASGAIRQVEDLLRQLAPAIDAARKMARNAEMERNLALGKPPAGASYNEGPQGRMFDRVEDNVAAAYKSLGALRAAASYDPKHPPK